MNGVGLQEPAIEKKPAGAHGLNLSALAVRERSMTLFFLLAIIIAGAVAYLTLGRAEDPTFTLKVFTVAAAWPGATAQEMQDLPAKATGVPLFANVRTTLPSAAINRSLL